MNRRVIDIAIEVGVYPNPFTCRLVREADLVIVTENICLRELGDKFAGTSVFSFDDAPIFKRYLGTPVPDNCGTALINVIPCSF